ncbi:hypothetical protein AURDEDRAFT_167032 [Auricularia subglabra TFB-10046 SS5]|nr:hypothetical protein AURDEDRAFT_167032 [Auricularia subglabra TFB-10046 SS5]
MNHRVSVPSHRSLADANDVDALVHSLFYSKTPDPKVDLRTQMEPSSHTIVSMRSAERPGTPDIESDIQALLQHARRTNVLKQCIAECDAFLAELEEAALSDASYSSPYSSGNGTSFPSFPHNSPAPLYSSLYCATNAAPLPSSPDAAVYIDRGSIAQARPPTRSDSDGGSSFFDTEWLTPDGLVNADRLEKGRLGTVPIDDLVPDRPYALSSAGWRQIGDLYLELVANFKDTALRTVFPCERDRDMMFARIAQMRMKAGKMYRIAHQVSDDPGEDDWERDMPEEPYAPLAMPRLRVPVAIRARHAGEPEPLDWLEDMAEVHNEYFRLAKKTGGRGGPLRGRPIREELESVERAYKVKCMDPKFARVM